MKRADGQLENPYKRKVPEYKVPYLTQVTKKNFVPLFEAIESQQLPYGDLYRYKVTLEQWRPEQRMRILFRNMQHWFVLRNRRNLLYFSLALQCDVPILEAVYWVQFHAPITSIFVNNIFYMMPDSMRKTYKEPMPELLERIGLSGSPNMGSVFNGILEYIKAAY